MSRASSLPYEVVGYPGLQETFTEVLLCPAIYYVYDCYVRYDNNAGSDMFRRTIVPKNDRVFLYVICKCNVKNYFNFKRHLLEVHARVTRENPPIRPSPEELQLDQLCRLHPDRPAEVLFVAEINRNMTNIEVAVDVARSFRHQVVAWRPP